MAGSYAHVVDSNGDLLSNEDFIGMIENLGDAYEAIEEMYYMIEYFSNNDDEDLENAKNYATSRIIDKGK